MTKYKYHDFGAFELIMQAALVNFILNFTFWKSWKSEFEHFDGKIANIKNKKSLALRGLFSLKLYQAFKIAQYKQLRLIKLWLNFDLNFIFKSSGTALLETIGYYYFPSNLSQKNRKTLPPAPVDTSTTAFAFILSSIPNCS